MSKELIKRILSSIILIPLALYFVLAGSFYFIFFTIICFLVASYEWHKMTKKINYKLLGLIFLIFSFFTFYESITNYYRGFFVLLICVATDVGGYIFGKIFKGPKLTKISPNKTYSGMIGGYFLSLMSLSYFINWIDQEISVNWLVATILLSTISQIGDIIISYFKRISKIKNTGKIIPGHGGLLDRIDGMIFAFPFFYLIELMEFLN
tara:strand:+ start:100 stop:723 length:624 start_codon:yes stop_codon:yes gene_type:complete